MSIFKKQCFFLLVLFLGEIKYMQGMYVNLQSILNLCLISKKPNLQFKFYPTPKELLGGGGRGKKNVVSR